MQTQRPVISQVWGTGAGDTGRNVGSRNVAETETCAETRNAAHAGPRARAPVRPARIISCQEARSGRKDRNEKQEARNVARS